MNIATRRVVVLILSMAVIFLFPPALRAVVNPSCETLVGQSKQILDIPMRCYDYPDSAVSSVRQANSLLLFETENDSLKKAAKLFRAALERWPTDESIFSWLSSTYLSMTENDPLDENFSLEYFLSLWDSGQQGKARPVLQRAYRLKSKEALAVLGRPETKGKCVDLILTAFLHANSVLEILDRLEPIGTHVDEWKMIRASSVNKYAECTPETLRELQGFPSDYYVRKAYLDYQETNHPKQAAALVRLIGVPDSVVMEWKKEVKK